ncbi:MAG TPA: hypothetical protein DDW98_15780 [Gammaproteobacteria bacterium]|nr:hypothetical protein [Gammaproteobacteria bacterium]
MKANEQKLVIPKQQREIHAERAKRLVMDFLPGEEVEVMFRRRKRERSLRQCRYLNGVAYKLLGNATGYDRDDISEFLCGTYFGWKDKPIPGKRVKQVPVRTTTTDEEGKRCVLSKLEFAEYVDFVQRFGAKHGVVIPDPDPEYFLDDKGAANDGQRVRAA